MNNWDWQYFKDDEHSTIFTERIEWLNLIEKGKLVLPLRHVRLIYRDENNNETHSEFALTHCIDHGCRATLDTKSYYIYGPASQLSLISKLRASECSENTYKNLPDIEFSFFDIDVDHRNKISGLTVDVTLEPADYMINANENSIDDGSSEGMNCVAGIGDHGTQYGWNLGILFMKRIVMIYDFKEDRLGFVRANNDY